MPREIKFRGKTIDGQWRYGQLAVLSEDLMGGAKAGYYISNKAGLSFAYRIQPKTVGQYTGLKDKNGREIYEGDIVTGLFNHTEIIGHIIYGSDATFFIKRKGLYGIGLNNAEDWLEVVGNIYENPELLKE